MVVTVVTVAAAVIIMIDFTAIPVLRFGRLYKITANEIVVDEWIME
jgi:hypothetical protein